VLLFETPQPRTDHLPDRALLPHGGLCDTTYFYRVLGS